MTLEYNAFKDIKDMQKSEFLKFVQLISNISKF